LRAFRYYRCSISSLLEGPPDNAVLIAKVVSNLADDYQDQGGYLSGDHVLRAVERRGLDQEDESQIRQQWHEFRIEIDDPESAVEFEHLDENARRSICAASSPTVYLDTALRIRVSEPSRPRPPIEQGLFLGYRNPVYGDSALGNNIRNVGVH
jgi:hypothetical protein